MSSNIQLAKEIFLKYCGSHFHMEREGEYKLYKSFNITKEQEKPWIKELQKELLEKVKEDDAVGHNFNLLCSSIRQYYSLDILKELVDYVNSRKEVFDTFSMMLMAEGVLGIVESFERSNLRNHETVEFARAVSIEILECLLNRPISIAPIYLQDGDLAELSNHKYIQKRIRKELANWIK